MSKPQRQDPDELYQWDPETQSYYEVFKRLIIKPAENDVIGIKIGNSNISMAVIEHGTPMCIRVRDESTSQIPTAVSISVEGVVLLGKQALERQVLNPAGVVYDFAKFIGLSERAPDVMDKDQKLVPYKLISHKNEIGVELWEQKYSMGQLMDFLLKKINWIAERQLVRKVEQCVLTVPPAWTEEQREHFRTIVSNSGWKVNDIITEPVAIAFAYGKRRPKGQKIAIFDMGGTSFTFSLLEAVEDDFLTVKSTKSSPFIGGIDFDNIILDTLIFQAIKELGIDFRTDELVLTRLKMAAKAAKEQLSHQPEVEVDIPFIFADQLGPKHFKTTLKAEVYNETAFPYLWRTIRFVNQAFEEAEWNVQDVDQVILAGGMAKWPVIKNLMDRYFGGSKPIFNHVPVDEVTALGAAIFGELQRKSAIGNPPQMNPLNLGFSISGGIMHNVVERGVFFPTQKSTRLTTTQDNQTNFRLDIYQGQRKVTSRNKYVGSLVVENLDPQPAGTISLEVEFNLDNSGVLRVDIQDMYTKYKVSDTFGSVLAHGLTKEQLEYEVTLGQMWESDDQHAVALMELHSKSQEVHNSLVKDAERVVGSVPPNLIQPFYESIQHLRDLIENPKGVVETDYKRAIANAQRHYSQFEEYWFQSPSNQAAVDLRNRWELHHAAYLPHQNIQTIDETGTKLERIKPPRTYITPDQTMAPKVNNNAPDYSWYERVYEMPLISGYAPSQRRFLKRLIDEGRYRATGEGRIRNVDDEIEQLKKTEDWQFGKGKKPLKKASEMDLLGQYFSSDYIKFDRWATESPNLFWLHKKRPPKQFGELGAAWAESNVVHTPPPKPGTIDSPSRPAKTKADLDEEEKIHKQKELSRKWEQQLEKWVNNPASINVDHLAPEEIEHVHKEIERKRQELSTQREQSIRNQQLREDALAQEADRLKHREQRAKYEKGDLTPEEEQDVSKRLRRVDILNQLNQQNKQEYDQKRYEFEREFTWGHRRRRKDKPS